MTPRVGPVRPTPPPGVVAGEESLTLGRVIQHCGWVAFQKKMTLGLCMCLIASNFQMVIDLPIVLYMTTSIGVWLLVHCWPLSCWDNPSGGLGSAIIRYDGYAITTDCIFGCRQFGPWSCRECPRHGGRIFPATPPPSHRWVGDWDRLAGSDCVP